LDRFAESDAEKGYGPFSGPVAVGSSSKKKRRLADAV
jgi:hypothetical protein